jgi:rubrerythrin
MPVIKQALIDILKQGMRIEYASIWYYPRLARRIKDREAAGIFNQVGQDSVRHASQVSQMLSKLGVNSESDLLGTVKEPEEGDVLPILKKMLEHEVEAARLYVEASKLAEDAVTRSWLVSQIKEEQDHARMVREVIDRIEGTSA